MYEPESGHSRGPQDKCLTCQNTGHSLRSNCSFKKLFPLTWYTASVLPPQPGKLKRMPADCYKLRVSLYVYSRYTHTVGWGCLYVVMKCSGAKRPYLALRCELGPGSYRRGNDLRHLDTMSILERGNKGITLLTMGFFYMTNAASADTCSKVSLITLGRSYFDKQLNT